MKRSTIDINCDMGEDPMGQDHNNDAALMPFVSSCNISCGAHSGSPTLIKNTVELAIRAGRSIGAHPSYPDREHFGRQVMEISTSGLLDSLAQQISWLVDVVNEHGGKLTYVKAHGALYHQLEARPALADIYCKLICDMDPSLAVMGMPAGVLAAASHSHGVRYIREAFLDRRYADGQSLVSRAEEGAVISSSEDMVEQLQSLLSGQVAASDGNHYPLEADSFCIHGDHLHSVELAAAVAEYLKAHHIKLSSHA